MISKSPDRHTFQLNAYIERCKEEGQEPDEVYMSLYTGEREDADKKEMDPAWQRDNLEYDLRSTEWILEKVRAKESYAQNLYAALCNNQFIKNEVWPILKGEAWGCSWRYAGGIIADMRQEGDYIDWYCSGIRGEVNDEEYNQMTKEEQENYLLMKTTFVGEGRVTDEIKDDLLRLGWLVDDTEREF